VTGPWTHAGCSTPMAVSRRCVERHTDVRPVSAPAGLVPPTNRGRDARRTHQPAHGWKWSGARGHGSARFHSPSIGACVRGADGGPDWWEQPWKPGGVSYRFTFVDVGNLPCLIPVDDPVVFDVGGSRAVIEHHPYFPKRVNVEFIHAGARRLRTDAGVGARGRRDSGLWARALPRGAAERRMGLAQRPSAGASLWGRPGASTSKGYGVFMTGPAEEVFTGHAVARSSRTPRPVSSRSTARPDGVRADGYPGFWERLKDFRSRRAVL